MLLNFKKQFVPFVLDGSKTHTIRATRKIAPKAGEVCHLYTGLRQKGAKLLGRFPCVKVEGIRIEEPVFTGQNLRVWIDSAELDHFEVDALFERDGFKRDRAGLSPSFLALDFWRDRLPFVGHIIHWDFSRPQTAPGVAKRLARMLETARAMQDVDALYRRGRELVEAKPGPPVDARVKARN